MTHTPGPWTISDAANVMAGKRLVANCAGYSESHNQGSVRAENCANARLIAAAPAMLEALEAALPYLANHIAMTLDEGPGDRIAYDKAEAAIALATGEPQC